MGQMPIIIKSDEEIAMMREAGRIVAQVLEILTEEVRPGVVRKELDRIVRTGVRGAGGQAHLPGLSGLPGQRLRVGQR